MEPLEHARQLLRPHFGDERTRRAFLNNAFFPDHRAVLDLIDCSGAPADFTERCVLMLDGYGPIDGRPALCRLLEAVAQWVGLEQRLEFQRAITELASPGRYSYLKELKAELDAHAHLYSPLAGDAKISKRRRVLPAATPSPLFKRFPKLTEGLREPEPGEQREYEDILAAFDDLGRAALVGEPGAGKTTALIRLAQQFWKKAEDDLEAPVPLLAPLGEWLNRDESLETFLAGQADALAKRLPTLMAENKVVLLLDGLNEIPTAQQVAKAREIAGLLKNEQLKLVVSCRERDYRGELVFKDLDKLAIRPLTPMRIQAFTRTYLSAFHEDDEAQGRAQAERLFWLVAGGEDVREVWEAWHGVGVHLNDFWDLNQPPDEFRYGRLRRVWEERVKDPRNLIRLAANPFMLWMLIAVYCDTEHLPANRASLFDTFIKMLLAREKLADEDTFEVFPEGEVLLDALGQIAWKMQLGAHERGEDSVQVSLLPEAIKDIADEEQLHRAASASLLETGGQIRFSHQLLQEYFVARQMEVLLDEEQLEATKLWPEQWERTGWEESSVLLAGLYAEDCTPVIEWLQGIQPEVAADCVKRSGAKAPRETLERLRAVWVARLTDIENEPDPRARAAVGRALGSLELDGYPLDNREGVWGVYLPNEKRAVVDIEWVEVPGGRFIYQEDEQRELEMFFMSRYPVTHSQFQAFVDDPEGYANGAWWADLERYDAPDAARWTYHNHPRETVGWYEALAFCRWLSALRGETITLPTEWQWERAARGRSGRQYPWGNDYRSGYANIDETENKTGEFYLEQTSAVGIYPLGRAEHGDQSIEDLAGNVWEWCLNKYDEPENIAIDRSDDWRVVRGGSWAYDRSLARAVFRGNRDPSARYAVGGGFRLVCSVPHP